MQKICIIGGGLTGLLLANFLARKNIIIDIYEKRLTNYYTKTDSKRTIAMSLSERGLNALEKVNLKSKALKYCTPTYGRVSYSHSNKIDIQNYSSYNYKGCLYTIERSVLTSILIENLKQHENINFFYSIDASIHCVDKPSILIEDLNSSDKNIIEYDYIFGCDGIFSKVRNSLKILGNTNFSLKELDLGYKEFSIPYSCNLKMDLDHVHVYGGRSAVFVGLPSNSGDRIIANLYAKHKNGKFYKDPKSFFFKEFPALLKKIPNIEEQDNHNPTNKMYELTCSNWNYKNKILLMGDSCHAITPFYAMGMNLCFEDCYEFDKLINLLENDFGKAIELFEKNRRPDTDAMKIMAFNNFSSLRGSSEAKLKLKWRVEKIICKRHPSAYSPIYSQIAFSNIPLREIYRNYKKQEKVVARLTRKSYKEEKIKNIFTLLKKIKGER